MEGLLGNLDQIAGIALAAVGGLVLIVRGLREIATLTKTDKDDLALDKVSAALNKVADLLDKITVSPKKD